GLAQGDLCPLLSQSSEMLSVQGSRQTNRTGAQQVQSDPGPRTLDESKSFRVAFFLKQHHDRAIVETGLVVQERSSRGVVAELLTVCLYDLNRAQIALQCLIRPTLYVGHRSLNVGSESTRDRRSR